MFLAVSQNTVAPRAQETEGVARPKYLIIASQPVRYVATFADTMLKNESQSTNLSDKWWIVPEHVLGQSTRKHT